MYADIYPSRFDTTGGTSDPTINFVLTADGNGNASWVSAGSGVSALDDLSDVTITGGADKHALMHNGAGQYVNRLLVEADISNLSHFSSADAVDAIEAVGLATSVSTDWMIFSDNGVLKKAVLSGLDENILTAIKSYVDGQTHTDINWNASTVTQVEAEAGVATTDRKWTAERVKQAIETLSDGLETVHPIDRWGALGGEAHSAISSASSFLGGGFLPASDIDARITYVFRLPSYFSNSVTINIVWTGNTDDNITYQGKTGYDDIDITQNLSTLHPPNSVNMDFVGDTGDWKLFKNTRDITSITREYLFVHVGSRASNASYIIIKDVYLTET